MTPPSTFDSLEYPRTYTTSRGWKAFLLIAGTVFVVGGVLGVWFFATDTPKNPGALLFLQALCLGFVAFGVFAITHTLKYRVVLTRESVEVRDLFKVRVLKVADIAGRRTIQVRNAPSSIELTPKDKAQKALKIAQTIHFDEPFKKWLAAIPDQDLLDEQKLEQDVATNPLYGNTPEERRQRLTKLRTLTKTLGMVGVGITFWGWIYPYPYELVIAVLILCPVAGLAIAMTSKGLIQIDQHVRDKRPTVAGIMITPAIVLVFRAFADFHLVAWQPAVLAGVVVGVLLVFCIARVDPQTRKWPALLLLLCVVTFPYAYGSIVELNALLDSAPAQGFEAKVLGMHKNTGKNPTWNLNVAGWGPVENARDVSVTRALYEQTQIGDTVCIVLHKGAMNLGWFWLGQCRKPE